jgi:hypothetical protein
LKQAEVPSQISLGEHPDSLSGDDLFPSGSAHFEGFAQFCEARKKDWRRDQKEDHFVRFRVATSSSAADISIAVSDKAIRNRLIQ